MYKFVRLLILTLAKKKTRKGKKKKKKKEKEFRKEKCFGQMAAGARNMQSRILTVKE